MRHSFSGRSSLVLFCSVAFLVGLAQASETDSDDVRQTVNSNPNQSRPVPFWTYQDFLDGKIPPKYRVRPGHPRLLITPDNKREIIDKIQAAPELWKKTIAKAEDKGKARWEWQQMLACAMIYQIGLRPGFEYSMTQEQYGRNAVELLMKHDYDKRQVLGGNPKYYANACAYDWLYDLLTAKQKRAVVAKMVEHVRAFSDRYGPYKLPAVNAVDNQAMIIGLAFYGDGVDDTAAEEIVEGAWNMILWNPDFSDRCVSDRARTVLYLIRMLEGGGNDEGINYFSSHATFPVHAGAWKTAAGVDVYARMGYFRNLPYWMSFMVRPKSDGSLGRLVCLHGYCWSWTLWYGEPSVSACMAAASGYLLDVDPQGAALAHWWVQKTWGGMDQVKYLPMFIYGLLLGDPRVEPTSPRELKLPSTHVMRGFNYVFARSDYWDNPDATVVAFGNGRYRYRAMPRNAFALFKNGAPLFLCRAHTVFHGYTPPGVVSGNEVVLYKGTEIHKDGLHMPPNPYVPSGSEKVVQVDSVPGHYDYMRGWRGKYGGYDHRILKGIETLSRTLVYLRPRGQDAQDYVVILDRTETTDPDLVPHVVFNTVFEPTVGSDWENETQGNLVHAGQWAIDRAPCVTVTMNHEYKLENEVVLKGHARGFLKTLYPKDIRVLKIGGLEHFMDDITGKGSLTHSPCQGFFEWDRAKQIEEGGYWRFHIVPQEKTTSHAVLNVIEATDSKFDKPAGPLNLLESQNILGVQAGPNIVLFSKDGKPLSSGTVKTAVAGTVRLIAADLASQTSYTLEAGGRSIKVQSTKSGTAFVERIEVRAGDPVRIER